MVAAVSKAVVENNLRDDIEITTWRRKRKRKVCTVFVELLTFDRIGKGEENSFDSHCFGGREGRPLTFDLVLAILLSHLGSDTTERETSG